MLYWLTWLMLSLGQSSWVDQTNLKQQSTMYRLTTHNRQSVLYRLQCFTVNSIHSLTDISEHIHQEVIWTVSGIPLARLSSPGQPRSAEASSALPVQAWSSWWMCWEGVQGEGLAARGVDPGLWPASFEPVVQQPWARGQHMCGTRTLWSTQAGAYTL